jgi:hypothetical protein
MLAKSKPKAKIAGRPTIAKLMKSRQSGGDPSGVVRALLPAPIGSSRNLVPSPDAISVPSAPLPEKLTKTEQKSLAAHEAVIQRGLGSFVEVGSALAAIRDNREYRGTHPTFEAYVAERWDIERRQAYRLIDASVVMADLCPTGHKKPHVLPVNEFQARALAKADSEDRLPIWNAVLKAAPWVNGQPKITNELIEAKRIEYTTDPDDLKRQEKERRQREREKADFERPTASVQASGMFLRGPQPIGSGTVVQSGILGDLSEWREVLASCTGPASEGLGSIATAQEWQEILGCPDPADGSDPDRWNGQPNRYAAELRGIASILRRAAARHLGQHVAEIAFRNDLKSLLRSIVGEIEYDRVPEPQTIRRAK